MASVQILASFKLNPCCCLPLSFSFDLRFVQDFSSPFWTRMLAVMQCVNLQCHVYSALHISSHSSSPPPPSHTHTQYIVHAPEQPQADLPSPPAGTRRDQVHVWGEAGDGVVCSELLLSLWQHSLHSGLQGRRDQRGQAVQSRARLREGHPPESDHPLLHVMSCRCNVLHVQYFNYYLT